MPRNKNVKIQHKHLILCEGKDAEQFLIHYLNNPALSFNPSFSGDIDVMDFGGNSELFSYLQLLRLAPDFNIVRSLCIIRDAESDANTAIKEIKRALEKTGFPVPESPYLWTGDLIKVGFVLFPTCDPNPRNGTLEDLCLSCLSESQSANILEEIDSFLTLLEKKGREFPRIFKTRLHTYLSTNDHYVSLKIGEAALAGAFNWNNTALNALRDFLSKVF